MAVLQVILNIVVFLLGLSFVVCIHEAGHLAVAKLCNVYCFEYSIGFGPLLFKHRFKHKKKKSKKDVLTDNVLYTADGKEEKVLGETQLSIRALPLGGYVAMAGEDGNLAEDGTTIPQERCLTGVNHFKQICIMLAGITMNFILAIILFTCAYWVPQEQAVYTGNVIQLKYDGEGDSPAKLIGMQDGDKILTIYQTYDNLIDKETKQVAKGKTLTFPVTEEQVEMTDYQKIKEESKSKSNLNYNDVDVHSISYACQDIYTNYWPYIDQSVKAFDLSLYDQTYNTDFSAYMVGAESTRTFHITYQRGEETFTKATDPIKTSIKKVNNKEYYSFGYLGISSLTKTYQASFTEGIQAGAKQFGSLFVGLYQALGSLFTPSGWKNVGGIISVYRLSAQGTQSGSMYTFLTLWGYISLNLGCFNLLPFPGLDGWQTLIALLESITRKKFPSKVKNVANTIGLIIMMVLAGLLIFKDIFVGGF